jgi:fatty-acyl-CoA synthase
MSRIAVTPSAHGYPLLIKQLLRSVPAQSADREIVYRDSVRYTYRTLQERIARLAHALTRAGIEPGDTVAVMDWDSHRYLECFFAIPMLGAVLQTVNVRLSPEQVTYTLNHAGARVILVNSAHVPLLGAIRKRLETVRQIILIDEGDPPAGENLAFAGEYEELLAASPQHFEFPDFDESTRATTFYTTGTTGLPKGVYFSHRQLVLHTLALLAALGLPSRQGRLHRDDVYMPITPMFHVHAWGFPYAATVAGVKQVYPGRYQPETLLRLIAREGVTLSHCVPTILAMLLENPIATAIDLRGWKVVVGGSALPAKLARAALDRGIDVFAGYGMSETGPVLTLAHVDSSLNGDTEAELAARVRAGSPIPLVDLRVVDRDMNDVAHEGVAVGEIVVRAPWLTQGYLHSPEASEQLWVGGYLHTNDIGCIGSDGVLRITDRLKDVIKTGGEWISSLEVEEIIRTHPAVSEVAVIGVRCEKWGERPMALVVLDRAHANAIGVEDIRAHVLAHADRGVISRYGVPERIHFVDALDKTSVGKLDKKALRARFSVA